MAHGTRQLSWNKTITIRKHVPLFFVYLVTKSYCIHNGQFQSNITFMEFICLGFKSNMWVKMWGSMVFKISIKQCVNQRWFSNSSLPWKKQRYIFTGAEDKWEKIELLDWFQGSQIFQTFQMLKDIQVKASPLSH